MIWAIQVASVVNDSLLSGDSFKERELFLPDVMRKVVKHDRDIDLLMRQLGCTRKLLIVNLSMIAWLWGS